MYWLATGKTGASSKKMAFTAIGEGYEENRPNHPLDPADFNRCLMLLDSVPEIRDHFDKIAALSKPWKAIIDNWDAIERSFFDEVGFDWQNEKEAPITYALMRGLRDD